MANSGSWATAMLGVAILSGFARAGELDSSRLKWATWPQGSSVASLRWGSGMWGQTQPQTLTPTPPPTPAPRLSILDPGATTTPPVVQQPLVVAPPTTFSASTSTPAAATASRFGTPAPVPAIGWPIRPATPASTTQATYNALVNMTDGGFVGAAGLTTGNEQPWYLSPVVRDLYDGIPTNDERMEFSREVLSKVETSFLKSGLNVSLTGNAGDSAAHTLSVVSNAQSPASQDAVGVTEVGRNGFTFIDKLPYSQTVGDLEWAVAHNVAHELMHAFGVDRHDLTGNYIDSAVANWSTLVDPDAMFSPEAIRELSTRDFNTSGAMSLLASGGQGETAGLQLLAEPVPEPTTWLAWGVGAFVVGWVRVRMSRRAA